MCTHSLIEREQYLPILMKFIFYDLEPQLYIPENLQGKFM